MNEGVVDELDSSALESSEWITMEEADLQSSSSCSDAEEKAEKSNPYQGYVHLEDDNKQENVVHDREWDEMEHDIGALSDLSSTDFSLPPDVLKKMLPRAALAGSSSSVLAVPLEPEGGDGQGFASRFHEIDFEAVRKVASQIQLGKNKKVVALFFVFVLCTNCNRDVVRSELRRWKRCNQVQEKGDEILGQNGKGALFSAKRVNDNLSPRVPDVVSLMHVWVDPSDLRSAKCSGFDFALVVRHVAAVLACDKRVDYSRNIVFAADTRTCFY
jgi:hypothetical protein